MCRSSQARETRRIAQASWYRHGARDCRHERHVVGQLQQVGNRECKGDLAAYGNALVSTVKYLFAPIARSSIFIKEHGRISLVC